MIKRILRIIKSEYMREKYNKLNNTCIESRYADLNAKYGRQVRIGKNS